MTATLSQELLDFLTDLPLVDNPSSRKALLVNYGPHSLLNALNWQGSTNEFCTHLLETLTRAGRDVLLDFLGSLNASGQYGLEKQEQLAQIIEQLKNLDKASWRDEFTSLSASDIELRAGIRAYLKELYNYFDKFEDDRKQVALRTQPGKLGSKTSPVPLQSKAARYRQLKATLTPSYSPEPPPEVPEPDKTQPVVDLNEFLLKHRRIALLGAPGAGKSTTLRKLAREFGSTFVEAKTPDNKSLIPIFVELNRWQDLNMGLLDFLKFEVSKFSPVLSANLPELMQKGRILLLLDALNELPQLKHYQAKNKLDISELQKESAIDDPRATAIGNLSDTYPAVFCALSCRAKEFLGGPSWHDLHLLDLTQTQVAEFARVYFEPYPNADQLVQRLLDELYTGKNKNKDKIQELARQPFYLSYLVGYFEAEGVVPDNTTLLLTLSVDDAFKYEVEKGLMTTVEAELLQDRLSLLAFNMTDAGQIKSVDKKLAAAWFYELRKWQREDDKAYQEPVASERVASEANRLWQLAEGAGFITVLANQIQFNHQLLQEFFCVNYCNSQLDLSYENLERLAGIRFNEIWFMWPQLNDKLKERLTEILEKDEDYKKKTYAAIALGYIGDAGVVDRLIDIIKTVESSRIRLRAVRALVKIGAPAIHPVFTALQENDMWVRNYFLQALISINDTSSIDFFISSLKSENTYIRQNTARILGNLGDERALEALIAIAKDKDSWVRFSVAEALGKIGNPKALAVLEWLNQNDGENWQEEKNKQVITEAIAKIKAKNGLS